MGRASLRRIEPERLDSLPSSDPSALRSRRDLERVNVIMRNAPRLHRLLVTRLAKPPAQLVELGGGDGRQLLSIAKAIGPAWRGVAATIVDPRAAVAPATRAAFAALGWRLEIACEDAESHLTRMSASTSASTGANTNTNTNTNAKTNTSPSPSPRTDDHPRTVIIANLFLHHLNDEALCTLFACTAERATLFAACEPRRSAAAAAGSRLLWAIGCNDVSRHDAVVSVRAGFTGQELSELWPRGPWRLEERSAGLFSHLFAAWRTEGDAP